jgi:hypothetical protein
MTPTGTTMFDGKQGLAATRAEAADIGLLGGEVLTALFARTYDPPLTVAVGPRDEHFMVPHGARTLPVVADLAAGHQIAACVIELDVVKVIDQQRVVAVVAAPALDSPRDWSPTVEAGVRAGADCLVEHQPVLTYHTCAGGKGMARTVKGTVTQEEGPYHNE